MALRKIDTQTEVRIVALIARGDPYSSIVDTLAQEGISLSMSAITDIKQRNTAALEQIKTSLVVHETSKATKILDKARKQLEEKLDNKELAAKEIAEVKQMYDDGLIDFADYATQKRHIEQMNNISIKDLTTVSKEMFNQSQIEAGRPTSIATNPEENKKNLMVLLQAIHDKDEVGMLNSIFPDA